MSLLIQDIYAGIDTLDIDEGAKQRFREFVRGVRVAHGDGVGIEREDRTAFATSLLGARVPRSEIRDRLISRYDLSRRQAYRVIAEALCR